jgi:DNA-binding CsgD family transcriptional regulator/tetratricopeptide (TPR) repeat protein
MTVVERQKELALLQSHFEQCIRGTGRIVLITGSVASGKTELLDTFAKRAVSTGAMFLGATGSSTEQDLPLSVIGQLIVNADVDPELIDRIMSGGQRVALGRPGSSATEKRRVQVLRAVSTTLLDLARQQPVLIGIDDVHLCDALSQQSILYLVRRMHSARLLLVLNEVASPKPAAPMFHAELMSQPHCSHIPLALLSRQGVAELLRERMEPARADRLAATCHDATGGNPLLVNAVALDQSAAAATVPATAMATVAVSASLAPDAVSDPSDELAVGDAFDQAVISYLYRCPPEHREVARAVAVLGDSTSPALISRLIGVDAAAADRTLAALRLGGLLDATGLRHPRARNAILDDMHAARTAELHRHAAELLYAGSAPPAMVAEHLLRADIVDFRWAPATLRIAAREALDVGATAFAASCLGLAQQSGADARERALIKAVVARVEWRADPALAARHFDELVEAVRGGHLTGLDALMLIRWILWSGRPDQAIEAIEHVSRACDGTDAQFTAELRFTQLWITYLYPAHRIEHFGELASRSNRQVGELASRSNRQVGELASRSNRQVGEFASGSNRQVRELASGTNMPFPLLAPDGTGSDPEVHASAVLYTVLSRGVDEATAVRVEQVLQRTVLDDTTLAPLTTAIAALIYADEFDRAAVWCERLAFQAAARHAPAWQAILSELQAAVAMRRGDLAAAMAGARKAFDLLPPSGWGVAVGMPLSTLLFAATAAGDYDEAARQLDQPIPDAMFQTTFGLPYLHARGNYYLATNRLHAALDDFQACGNLMDRWGVDGPALVPWRTEAAQVWLRLGQLDTARGLVADQLELVAGERSPARAITLRIQAATSDGPDRLALITEAVDILEASGDRLELARALADMSRVQRELGDIYEARQTVGRAWSVARECRAEALCRTLLPSLDPGPVTTEPAAPPVTPATPAAGTGAIEWPLSDAELRVAALAARGLTNREIAGDLFITVSTVEQHLTRVYRKLRVRRRTDLPSRLPSLDADSP